MKLHTFPLLAAAAATLALCSSGIHVPDGEYLIAGRLENVPDSGIVRLCGRDGNLVSVIRTDTLVDGKFTFRDTTTVTRTVMLLTDFSSSYLEIWVAPGKRVDVRGHDKQIRTWSVKSDIPEQIEETRYTACAADETAEVMKLDDRRTELIRAARERKDDAGYVAAARAERDSLDRLIKSLNDTIDAKILRYMEYAPVTPIWMDKLLSFAKFLQYGFHTAGKEKIEKLYDRLPAQQRQTETGQLIYDYLHPAPTVGIGDEMVDGDLYDTEGNLRHLSEFRGRYILLEFWSRGCGACYYSIPAMKEVAETYKEKLTMVCISQDKEQGWKDFVRDNDLAGNQWNELRNGRTGLSARYRVNGIPCYVLIAPDGRIQDVWDGFGREFLLNRIKNNLK